MNNLLDYAIEQAIKETDYYVVTQAGHVMSLDTVTADDVVLYYINPRGEVS